MPARTRRIMQDDRTRERIRSSQIINRLQNCALGKVELTAVQVRAAETLLRKALPDLQSVELSGPGGGAIPIEINDNDRARGLAALVSKLKAKG